MFSYQYSTKLIIWIESKFKFENVSGFWITLFIILVIQKVYICILALNVTCDYSSLLLAFGTGEI